MSEIKVNKITPRVACGTTQLGDSGDTITIPSGATITNAGTASGFGATGETSWDTTVKTTGTFTATSGVGYFLNTTGGIITVNLPAGTAGDSVAMADYAATWQTNNVTVSPNGSEKIGGVDSDITLSTEGQSVTLVYVDGTQGWVNVLDSTSNVRGNPFIVATGGCITTCGDYKIHTFLSPNTFTVTNAGAPPGSSTVDYVVVGGGASGGSAGSPRAGGGGAGGYRESPGSASSYTASPLGASPATALAVPVAPYPITVGGGGAPVSGGNNPGNNGSVSTFSTISSAGGGAGGAGSACYGCAALNGGPGGSGGGSGGAANADPSPIVGGTVGTGNTPVVSPAQGQDGGQGMHAPGVWAAGGGGGGASAAGGDSSTKPTPGPASVSGTGANGVTTQIPGSPLTLSGGGGANGVNTTNDSAAGGSGGGGAGNSTGVGVAGGTNTGGGGGAGPDPSGSGQGGSGIVIIRYKYQ
jgi:hypothetical protein